MQVKTKTANGMAYTATGVYGGDQAVKGDLSIKLTPVAGATITSKLFTTGNMTHEAVLDKLGVNGLKLTFLGGMGSRQIGVTTMEYMNKNVALTTAMDVVSGPVAHATLTAGSNAFTCGVEGEYDTSTKEFKKGNFVVNYSDGKESEATVTVLNKGDSAKLAYSHDARPDLSIAGEFAYNRKADAKQLTMGIKYKVDSDTTLKAKINSEGMFSASYIQVSGSGRTS